MKKSLSLLLALLLLITCVVIATPTAQAAIKKEAPKRVIAFVFDNSGTMYIGDADSSKAWCRATYAMEALATMMNPSDVMLIYPMNPIRIGNDTSKVYTDESPLKVTRDNASVIRTRRRTIRCIVPIAVRKSPVWNFTVYPMAECAAPPAPRLWLPPRQRWRSFASG